MPTPNPTRVDGFNLKIGPGIKKDAVTGEISVDPQSVATELSLGEASKVDVMPIELGGTGAGTPEDARKNLGLGTASAYDTGTDSGTIPVRTADGALNASEFAINTDNGLSAAGLKLGGSIIVKTPAAAPALIELLTEVAPSSDPATMNDLVPIVSKLNEAITTLNGLIGVLSTHHKLIV